MCHKIIVHSSIDNAKYCQRYMFLCLAYFKHYLNTWQALSGEVKLATLHFPTNQHFSDLPWNSIRTSFATSARAFTLAMGVLHAVHCGMGNDTQTIGSHIHCNPTGMRKLSRAPPILCAIFSNRTSKTLTSI